MLSQKKPHVFICYARANKDWTDDFKDWLRDYPIVFDDDIKTGDLFEEKIIDAIDNAFAAVCLLTEDFFSSDFISKKEIPQMLANQEKLVIIPVVISSCRQWYNNSALQQIQCLNPFNEYLERKGVDREKYFTKLQEDIDEALTRWREKNSESDDEILQVGSSNLPMKPKWFEGYKEQKDKLKKYIINEGGLITITGSPRVGRRTLVNQIAHELYDDKQLPGGALWVDCSSINSENKLIQCVGQLCLKPAAPNSPAKCQKALEDYFKRNRALVILNNIQNYQPGLFDKWAMCVPMPSAVVYITFAEKITLSHKKVHLTGLDPKSSERLFRSVVQGSSVDDNFFSGSEEKKDIQEICKVTQYNPLLIELYANKCSEGFLLPDILELAQENKTKDVIEIWKKLLDPLFDALTPDHRDAFLKLSRLPSGVSRDLVEAITGIKASVLGPAIQKQFLWENGGGYRYQIDPSVRQFAKGKLTEELSEIDRQVAANFTKVAENQANIIDKAKISDRSIKEKALNWFFYEWNNFNFCIKAVGNDLDTLYRLSDTVLQFMITRGGYLDDCLHLYQKVERVRKKDQIGYARTLNDLAVCLQFKHSFGLAKQKIMESIQIQYRLLPAGNKSLSGLECMFRLAQSWNTCGFIRLENNEYSAAVEAFVEAEKLCHQIIENADFDNEIHKEAEIERSQTLSNIGYCHTLHGKTKTSSEERDKCFNDATTMFQDSISIDRPEDWRVGQTLSRRGELYLEKKIWRLARKDFELAIKSLEYRPFELGHAYQGLGHAYLNDPTNREEYKGFEYLLQARKQFDLYDNDSSFLFKVNMDIAIAKASRGQYQEAEEYAMYARSVAEKGKLKHKYKEAEIFIERITKVDPED